MEMEKARGTEWGRGTKRNLVLGGTGKTGRRVVRRLVARGFLTRVGSRSGEPPFDWEDEATWAPALRDVESVYISYYPDLAVPGAVAAVRSFVDLAVEAGVGRLVLLSGRGEEEALRAELALRADRPPALDLRGGGRRGRPGGRPRDPFRAGLRAGVLLDAGRT